MRIEEIISDALDKVGHDRYRLSIAVGQRADELSKGAKPLLDTKEIKDLKYTDIALREIAKGLLKLEKLEEEVR